MFVLIVQHDSPTVHITATAVVNLLLSQRMTLWPRILAVSTILVIFPIKRELRVGISAGWVRVWCKRQNWTQQFLLD